MSPDCINFCMYWSFRIVIIMEILAKCPSWMTGGGRGDNREQCLARALSARCSGSCPAPPHFLPQLWVVPSSTPTPHHSGHERVWCLAARGQGSMWSQGMMREWPRHGEHLMAAPGCGAGGTVHDCWGVVQGLVWAGSILLLYSNCCYCFSWCTLL